MDARNRPNRRYSVNDNAPIKSSNKAAAAAVFAAAPVPMAIDDSANNGSASTNGCCTESGDTSLEPPKPSVEHNNSNNQNNIEQNADAVEKYSDPIVLQLLSKNNQTNNKTKRHTNDGSPNLSDESNNFENMPVSESSTSSFTSLSANANGGGGSTNNVNNNNNNDISNNSNAINDVPIDVSRSASSTDHASSAVKIMINPLADDAIAIDDSSSSSSQSAMTTATATTAAAAAQTPDSDNIVSKAIGDKSTNNFVDSTNSDVALKSYKNTNPIVNRTSIGKAEQLARAKCDVDSKSNLFNSERNLTKTLSSDSIDVRAVKCHENDDEDDDDEHESTQSNGVEPEKSNSNSEDTTTKTSTSMDDDRLQRVPLLGNGGTSSIGYNSIDKDGNNGTSVPNDAHYNDYVNLLCDSNVGHRSVEEQRRLSFANGRSRNNFGRRDENRPLLRHQQSLPNATPSSKPKSIQKPRGIVKSPSTQIFGSTGEKFAYESSRKPRLSIQCSGSDPDRPVLHVQFLSEHNQIVDEDSEMAKPYPPSSVSYQNGPSAPGDNFDRPLSSRLRSSISSTSSTSSSSSSDSDSSSDEGSSIGQFAEAKPPDGGWGWVVVFASFMVNLIADGITFSFGVIYAELLKYFGESKAKTAWIGSLFMAMPLLSGPVASFLTDRYGCRKVTIAGSILASIGFIISSFTDSIEMLFFTFGIFAGFGLSLCYVAAVVIVAYYFDKRRSFATGLSVCGSGIGTFIFAPLTQILIDEYGWRGTTLIMAGVFLNMTVCGMLMRDLEWTTYKSKQKAKQRKKKYKLGVSADSFSVSNSTNTGGTTSNLQKDESNGNEMDRSDENGDGNPSMSYEDDPRLFSSLITLPTFVKNGEKVPIEVLELLSANRNISNDLLKNYPSLAHSRSFSQPLTTTRHSHGGTGTLPIDIALSPGNPEHEHDGLARTKSRRIRNEQAFLTWLKHDENAQHPKDVRMMMRRHHGHHAQHPTTAYLKDLRMHRHSLTYRGAMLNINRYRLRASSCPDIYRNSMTTIAKEKTQWGQGVDEFKAVLMDMLDFSFFGDIRFTLFALSNFFLYAWYDVPYVYLADNAIEIGYSETDASILISMIGIVNMFGEIILGWFGDRKFVTAGMIYAICMLFCGLVTGLVPLLKSYMGLSVLSGFFGLFIAANYALTSIILVELITLDRFTNAYGLLLLVQGIANLIGPPLAGWITDMTGNYDLAFYLAGIFIAVSGFLMLILPARGKIRKYRAVRRSTAGGSKDDDDEDDDGNSWDDDVEQRIAAKLDPKCIVTPKSALKINGTKNNLFGNSTITNGNSKECSTLANQV